MKGGVGKTTLTANLAIGLSTLHNKKVLLVDLDPQFNLTQYLMHSAQYLDHIKDSSKCTVKDIFIKNTTDSIGLANQAKQQIPEVVPNIGNCSFRISSHGNGHVDLIPSTLNLMEVYFQEEDIENKLSKFLKKIQKRYDYILIDCPPTVSLFTTSAFLASDSYLTPIKPDWLSSIGLSLIDRMMKTLTANYGKPINFMGIIFVMVKNNRLTKNTMESLQGEERWKCFKNSLSESTRIAETGPHKNIFDLVGKSLRYREEMIKITEEFELRAKKQ